MTLPIIAITMGDPSGIGPEIIVASYSHNTSFLNCSLLVIGNSERLKDAAKILKQNIKVNICKSTNDIVTKDKKYLELNKVLEIRKYCMNEQWRDPHFLTFYMLLLNTLMLLYFCEVDEEL